MMYVERYKDHEILVDIQHAENEESLKYYVSVHRNGRVLARSSAVWDTADEAVWSARVAIDLYLEAQDAR
jgi:hypothetical protein